MTNKRTLTLIAVSCSVAVTTAMAAATVAAESSAREEISLNGPWQYRLVSELDHLPGDEDWKPCDVPGYLRGYDYKRAWFRRSFSVPESMRGKRIKLSFGGVKFNSRVYVNGKHVGGCFGGYEPFEVDVTDSLRFDRPNALLVGCHDWTGVFAPGKVEFKDFPNSSQLRSVPRDKILSPVGGLFSQYGIWDDVTLTAQSAVFIQDVFVKPSVRRGELVVDYTLTNRSTEQVTCELRAAIEDGGRDVLRLPSKPVRIAAGASLRLTLQEAWPAPHLWSHVDPHLYYLRTELSSGDSLRTRFGFREFWTEGHRFYLNGQPITLLATAGWPPRDKPMTREEIRQQWEAIRKLGCVAFRTHTQPWPSLFYEVADEVGILVIIEGAVFNDDTTYRVFDPVFWDNYASHLEAMVRTHKNHPSVVMWSMENEFHGARMNDQSPAKADLVRMGRLVKQCDPTRPILYESDGDPGGAADVIGIHYPHEYPFFTCWPNEAWWLSAPQPSDRMFLNGQKEFFWRKEKPLYVGEFLWIPSNDPSWNTVFLGDDAYIDYREYRDRAKAESWRMQILGYRHFEVGGMCPWTVMESGTFGKSNHLYEAVQYAYQPIAAYCHDYDRRFHAGEPVARRVEVFNNVLQPSSLTFTWTLTRSGTCVDQGEQRLELGPAGQQMLEVTVHMPDCLDRTPVDWQLTLTRDGQPVFHDTHHYTVFPRLRLPKLPVHVGLFDPAGITRKRFDADGVATQNVESLERLGDSLEVLVIGANAFETEASRRPVLGYVDPRRDALRKFVEGGGRVLVLEQNAYPEGLFGTSLSDQRSTMTFPLATSHPALKDVRPGDLKFWRGDHMVVDHGLLRPDSGSLAAIVVSGSVGGVDHAPLLERRCGQGCIVHCQLKLLEKFETEPAAARILVNLLEYVVGYHAATRTRTGLVGGTDTYRSYLRGLGLRIHDLTGKLAETDLSEYSLIVLRGKTEATAKLRAFVEQGGNVLMHRADVQDIDELARAIDVRLALRPFSGTVTRCEGHHPLLEAVTREDVYWLGEPASGAGTTPRAQAMTDGVFVAAQEKQHSHTTFLTDPPAVACVQNGGGTAVFDQLRWDTEEQNTRKAARYVCSLLTALGGDFAYRSGVTIQCEDMTPQAGRSQTRNRGSYVWMGSEAYLTTGIEVGKAGVYTIDVVAGGSQCDGIYPLVDVCIDDKKVGQIQLTVGGWRSYPLDIELAEGAHRLALEFTNDLFIPGKGDRNVSLDKVTFVEKSW